MTPKDLLKKYKTQAAIADAFHYTRAAVSIWVRNNSIPFRAQQLIESSTAGEFKAQAVANTKRHTA